MDVSLVGVSLVGVHLVGVYLVGVYLVGVYPQACISWACTSLRVPNWYVRYGHAPHWHASHKRVHHGRRRYHGVGRESSSHVCNTNCVRAQVHLAILSLALFVLMIRHTFFLSRGSRHLTVTHRQNNLHSPLAHAHQLSAFWTPPGPTSLLRELSRPQRCDWIS
jgi:hypothetical protein